MYVRRVSVRICACPVETDRRQRDGEAATSCASSQIARSLTNWVERMRRTYLVFLIRRKTAMKKHGGEANSTSASIKGACESPPVSLCLFCHRSSFTLVFDIDCET